MAVDVEAALWESAVEQARRHGFPFSPQSEQLLHALVANGAQTMKQEGVVEPGPRMDEAVEHTHEFVDAMAELVRQRSYSEFHEDTFMDAERELRTRRSRFWPFW